VMMTTTDAAGKPLNRPALAKGKEDAEWKGILYERKWWSQYTSKGTCYIGTLGGTSYWYTPTDWVKKKIENPFALWTIYENLANVNIIRIYRERTTSYNTASLF
jgi:hypothetical protein